MSSIRWTWTVLAGALAISCGGGSGKTGAGGNGGPADGGGRGGTGGPPAVLALADLHLVTAPVRP